MNQLNQAMPAPRRDRRPVPGTSAFDRTNPVVYLGTLKGVKKARARDGALVAPIDIDPELMKWPVQDLAVLLVADPDRAVEAARIAGAMIRDGAILVSVVSQDGPLSFHKKESP